MGRDASSTRKWEKERRDRLNNAFDNLGKVLPNYNPSQTLVKIEILTKAALHIKDLEEKLENIVLPETNKEEIETEFVKNLQEHIKKLIARNEQLCKLLRDAKIKIPRICGPKKFRTPQKWANILNDETAEILSKKEGEPPKRTRKSSKKKFRQTTTIAQKHKKILKSRFDERKVKPAKRKNIILPQKYLIVVTQPNLNSQCYIITNPPRNTLVQNNFTNTVNTNTNLRLNSKQLPGLGPGTLILANGTILPVIPNQNFTPTPTIITNNITPRNIQNVIVVSSINTPKINSVIQTQQKNINTVKHPRPIACLTQTTQVNKVPIPASRYAHSYVILENSQPKIVRKGKNIVKRKVVEHKSEESQTDDLVEPPAKKSKIEIISNEVINAVNADSNVEEVPVASTSKSTEKDLPVETVENPDKIETPKDTENIDHENVEKTTADDQNKQDTTTNTILELPIAPPTETHLKEKEVEPELPDLNANDELNLQHSELSNDLFASLQVPTGCQNPESTSPTAAFLLTFPLVSTLNGVKVTEVIDEENSGSQRGTPNLLQIGTMTNTRTTVSQSDALTPSLLNLDNFSFFTGKDFNNFTTASSIFTNTTSSVVSSNVFSNNYTFTFTTASSIVTSSVYPTEKVSKTSEVVEKEPKSTAYSQIPNLLGENMQPEIPSLPSTSMQPKIQPTFDAMQPIVQSTLSMQPKLQNVPPKTSFSLNLDPPVNNFNTVTSSFTPKLHNTSTFSMLPTIPVTTCENMQPKQPSTTSFNVQSIVPTTMQPKTHLTPPKTTHRQPIIQTTTFNTFTTTVSTTQPKIHISTNLFNTPTSSKSLFNNVKPKIPFNVQSIAPPTTPFNSMQPKLQPTTSFVAPTTFNMPPTSSFNTTFDRSMPMTKNYNQTDLNSARTSCSSYNPKSSNSYSTYYGDSNCFNTNYYKNINKNDTNSKNYYSMPTYDNYASDNYYASTSQKYNTSPNKSKQPTKQPINWMTTPDNRIQTQQPDYFLPSLSKENDFVYSNTPQTTYHFNTNTMYSTSEITDNSRKLDFPIPPSLSNNYQRTDLEEWSPTKLPQFLDPLVGDLGLNHIYEPKIDKRANKESKRNKNNSYDNQSQSNFLSVSQLVDSGKNDVPARTNTRRNSGNRAKAQQVKQKRKSQDNKDNTNKNNDTIKINKFVSSFNNQDLFCDSTKPKNTSSNYTAEALIGHTNNLNTDNNKKQNYPNKSLVPPPFLTDNIITYFPPVEFTQENQSYMPQNQAYNSNSFSHNFSTFQNTPYTTNNFIPSTTTTYIPTNNFVHDTHDFDNFNNIFSTPTKEKSCVKSNRSITTDKNLQTCYKKPKKKPSNDPTINNFDIQFLSMPNNRNSPILPDDFHTHTTYLPNPTTYKTNNPFSHNNNKTSEPLLPLPTVHGARNNQPEVAPVNPNGTSLTNFNLSTILGQMPEMYSRSKEQGSSRNYNASASSIQVPFSTNKSFNFSYNNN